MGVKVALSGAKIPIKYQLPIKQSQVESLIATVLSAYNNLLDLDGESYNKQFKDDLVEAKSTIILQNNLHLGKIVSNMINFTLETEIDGFSLNKTSPTYTENATNSEIDAFLQGYLGKVEDAKLQIIDDINQMNEINTKIIVGAFKNNMQQLAESYKTGKIRSISGAVERVAQIAYWTTQVDVHSLYQAAKTMSEVARFNESAGFSNAKIVVNMLEAALDHAKAWGISGFKIGIPSADNGIKGIKIPTIGRYEPKPNQLYKGQLDYDVIAKSLLHDHPQK